MRERPFGHEPGFGAQAASNLRAPARKLGPGARAATSFRASRCEPSPGAHVATNYRAHGRKLQSMSSRPARSGPGRLDEPAPNAQPVFSQAPRPLWRKSGSTLGVRPDFSRKLAQNRLRAGRSAGSVPRNAACWLKTGCAWGIGFPKGIPPFGPLVLAGSIHTPGRSSQGVNASGSLRGSWTQNR